MGRQVLRERQLQVREDAILEMARAMMLEQSYSAMSMDELATRVGISKATLYQHFPSKEDLAIHVIGRAMEQGAAMIAQLDLALPAIERLEQMLRLALERRSDFWVARLTVPPAAVMAHPLYQQKLQRLLALMADMVDEAKADGDIAAHLPTPVIVRILIASMRDADYGDLLAQGLFSAKELSDALVAIAFDGVRKRH